MSVSNYKELKEHLGHKIKLVYYGERKDPANVAIECHTCNVVLLDFDKEATEKIGCVGCGISIEVPVREDLTYEEKLCDLCYEDYEKES